MLVVTEPGLYRLALHCQKPEARVFQRWVTHDVLPSIRKTGKYELPQQQMSNAEMLLAQCQAMVAQEKAMLAIEHKVEEQEERLEAIEHNNDIAITIAEDAVRRVECNHGHFTVLAWAKRCHQYISLQESSRHGRLLTKICRERGIDYGTITDVRFNKVNTYPEDILEEYFGGLGWSEFGRINFNAQA